MALLSAMTGMFAGCTHAFALVRKESIAPMLAGWVTAMAGSVPGLAAQLESGDYVTGVTSNLAMQVAGSGTFLRTAEGQGVSAELLTPYLDLMARYCAQGHGEEGTAGLVDVLRR